VTLHGLAFSLARYHALGGGGGGGLAHLIVRLFIWRAGWRIHTFGPIIVILLVLAVAGVAVFRSAGARWPGQRPRGTGGNDRDDEPRFGPRDW
jgi:hypothetical protein